MFVHADCESRRASVIYLDKLFLPVTNCFNLDGACSEFMPHKKCEVGTEYALDITVGNDANLVSCASFVAHCPRVCTDHADFFACNYPSTQFTIYFVYGLSLQSCYHLMY